MTIRGGRKRGAWVALAAGIVAGGCAEAPPAGSLAATPAAFRLAHGESMALRLTWTPSRRLTETQAVPTAFVHLLHPTAAAVRTFDHRLPGDWEPGVPLSYDVEIALSALATPLPEGKYRLAVGLYDEASGYRWPLVTEGEDLDRRAYAVAAIEVGPPRTAERFEFTGGWREVEAGPTKQIVAWRWLREVGTVVTYADGGALQIRFRLGDLPENAAGTAATSLAFDGDCLIEASAVSGSGPGQVALPLRQGSPGERCSLRLRPQAGAAGAWARLDGIAWRPPAG